MPRQHPWSGDDDTPVAILVACWRHWADVIVALAAGDWDAPTRCGDWTVRQLAAHLAPDPDLLASLGDAVLGSPASVDDAADLLRQFNEPGSVAESMAPSVAATAVEDGASARPGPTAERFRRAADVVATSGLAPDAVVPHPVVGSVTVGVLTEVALMEATVHGLDLAAATGCAPPPPAARWATAGLLVRVAGVDRFIDAATGRSPAPILPVVR